MRRVLKGVGLVLVLLLVGAFVWEPLAVSEAAPPPSRTYDARIVRDEFGVPHIFGKTDADTAFGLAFAHAEDDFSTIEEVLAMTRGRYGALDRAARGPRSIMCSIFCARGKPARGITRRLPADVRAMLDGYAAGLNRYAAAHPRMRFACASCFR